MTECKFCGRVFKREATVISHVCEKKRRWQQRDDHQVKVAFLAWLKFMEYARRKKTPTYEDFMNSPLYNQLVRFANHMHHIGVIKPDNYIAYLIKHNIKMADWTKDFSYESYMAELIARETPEQAVERGIKLAEKWAEENEQEITNFFDNISPNRALHWIMMGKLSPWYIFCSSKSINFLSRLNEEQSELINKYIDRGQWKVRIKKHKSEFNRLSQIMEENGL